ncbi:MAG TPA: flagellar filament capping protein FliD [Dissulfurispiraceae bacterium]|nr:flagellar filament capping protein FliD [Dissulfurispiraceae bacterium]
MATTGTSSITGGAIDTASIVQQLMKVESQPLTKLQKKEAAYLSKITAIGSLLGSVNSLKSAAAGLKESSILGYKATLSDASYFTATTSSAATAGDYTIKVSSLAYAHRIATKDADNYTSLTQDMGTGTIAVTVNGATRNITIDDSNKTLQGVRDAINAADAGVKASIVQVSPGNYKMVLESASTGVAAKMSIDVTGATGDLADLAFNTGTLNMSQLQDGIDAQIDVNGLAVTRPTNTISDVIDGVTLTLRKESATAVSMSVGKDTDALKAKVNAFVAAYNALNTQIKQLRGSKDAKGALSGESVLLGLGNSIRGVTASTFAGNQLANLGISTDKNGVLSVDAAKLDAAITADSSAVVATLNAMGASLDSTLKTYVDGILPGRQTGLQATVKNIQKQAEAMSRRLDQIEARLKKQYTALDQLLQQLQGQSDYVTEQLSQISKAFGGSS